MGTDSANVIFNLQSQKKNPDIRLQQQQQPATATCQSNKKPSADITLHLSTPPSAAAFHSMKD
jgi:hypothetical protein